MVNANGQLEGRTVPGGNHGTIGEALHVMDLDAVARLSRLHGFFSREREGTSGYCHRGSKAEGEPLLGQVAGTGSVKSNRLAPVRAATVV
jgi:hypothetical protein